MDTHWISSRNMQVWLILMILCTSLLGGAFTSAQDSWIAVLLMGVLYLPMVLLYARLCALYPEKSLFDMMGALFGPVLRTAMLLLMSLYATFTLALMLRNFTEFTVVISLNNTPRIPLMIFLLLPVLYIASGGSKLLGRWSAVVFVFIVVNIVLTILLSLNIIDPSNILPIMDHKWGAVTMDASAVGAIAVGETALVMVIVGRLQKGANPYKTYLIGVLLGICLLALVILRNVLILGPVLEREAKFSTYMAVRIIDIGSFFERVESMISFNLILLGFTKMPAFLLASSMGAARLLKVENEKRLLVPMGLLALALCAIIFKNTFEMYEYARVYWLCALPFQLLIPLILWIAAEIQTRRQRAEVRTRH